MTDERTKSRVAVLTNVPGFTSASIEGGIDYTDGYRITVGWSESDACWYARCSGMTAFSPGEALAHGDTKEAALLDLCCSLAATVDAVGEPPTKAST